MGDFSSQREHVDNPHLATGLRTTHAYIGTRSYIATCVEV